VRDAVDQSFERHGAGQVPRRVQLAFSLIPDYHTRRFSRHPNTLGGSLPMTIRAVLVGVALCAALVAGPAAAEQRPAEVETCLGCHGIQGYKNAYPTYHVPKLGGQHAQYIKDALMAYASGARPHSTMHANAATLSEEQMDAIAKWFEEQGR
jgi:cytochrome c553